MASCQVNYEGGKQNGSWSLVGATSSLDAFVIDVATGAIYTTRDLDYEARSLHNLVVEYRVPPSENSLFVPLVAVTDVTVVVEDANDCSPLFQAPME